MIYYTITTGKQEIFLYFFKFIGTEEYNSYIFLGAKTNEAI
jgi:hypothetical protein